MSFFSFFKKKKHKSIENKTIETDNATITVSSDGKINGIIRVNTNFGNFEMPINTNAQKIEEKRKRMEDPNSCERQPNENEIVLPISRDYENSIIHRAFGWEKYEEYSKKHFRNILERYNNMIMLKSDYEEMLKYVEEKEAKEKLHWQLRSTYNKGRECERSGDYLGAEKFYYECFELDPKFYESFDRLIIMYRKNKEYSKEETILRIAINEYPDITKWQNRLTRIEKKKSGN